MQVCQMDMGLRHPVIIVPLYENIKVVLDMIGPSNDCIFSIFPP